MGIDQEIAEAIAKIQAEQSRTKQQFKAEVQKILEDELFAMAEFDNDDKLEFYLRSRFVKVIRTDSCSDNSIFSKDWAICPVVNGECKCYSSNSLSLRKNLIDAIATVEIAEAKAVCEFGKLPLHQKFWQFLQTFWK